VDPDQQNANKLTAHRLIGVAPTAAAVVLSTGLSFFSLSLILLLIGVR